MIEDLMWSTPGIFGLGMPIYSSPYLYEETRYQYRFPRSKKKRIRKKWRKDRRNWKNAHVPKIYIINGMIVMDPVSYEMYKNLPVEKCTHALSKTIGRQNDRNER